MKTVIVCGLDERLRWMWEFFAAGLVNCQGYEVIVYDFGLKTPIDRPTVEGNRAGWFAKPSAIARTFVSRPEVDSVIWLDLDVELIKPISQVVEAIQKKRECTIVGCPDPYMPNRFLRAPQPYVLPHERYREGETKGMVINTGFLYVRRDFQYLQQWNLACMYRTYRGDQEALADFLRCGSQGVGQFTKNECVLRLAPEKWRRDTCAIHWTGNEGKCIIREKIVQNRVLSIANQSKEVKNDG